MSERFPDCPQCGNVIPTEQFDRSCDRWGHTCGTCDALILLRPVVRWEVVDYRKPDPALSRPIVLMEAP